MKRWPLLVSFALSSSCSRSGLSDHTLDAGVWEEALEASRSCSGVEMEDAGPFGGRVMLTFDDGPHRVNTPRVLATLRAEQVPATFFALGEMLESADQLAIAQEIVADPLFDLANHSYHHDDLRYVSASKLYSEVDGTHERLVVAGAAPDLFRFPYGASTCTSRDRVESRGYRVVGWHVDSVDWCYAGSGSCSLSRVPSAFRHDMVGYVLDLLEEHDGGVVLLHDIQSRTADVLPALITAIRDAGYTFAALDDPAVLPLLNGVEPPYDPWLGETCDPADDRCSFAEPDAWCEPVADGTSGVCMRACEGYCPDRTGSATTFCVETPVGEGVCLGRSDDANHWCDDVPGTVADEVDRFVGASGASAARRTVCVPEDWSAG
ncbi:MAG: polysaccharide deacetylase family protein [Alphaproteobacteria bacterium]|nr:polysaccharide deacetylase family protein [Alphaproteobacteria bacterium]